MFSVVDSVLSLTLNPREILVSGPGFWQTERVNRNFILQKRKGHGTRGLSSLLVQTWDSVLDTKPPPYRSVT